jgi:hypothetical protein
VGDIFADAGFWIMILLCLVVLVWFRQQWKIFIVLCLLCISGFAWSLFTLYSFVNLRDDLGESVGWSGFNHAIE